MKTNQPVSAAAVEPAEYVRVPRRATAAMLNVVVESLMREGSCVGSECVREWWDMMVTASASATPEAVCHVCDGIGRYLGGYCSRCCGSGKIGAWENFDDDLPDNCAAVANPEQIREALKPAASTAASAGEADVWEMKLCEYTTHCLHPGILYRFTVDPDCDHCKSCELESQGLDPLPQYARPTAPVIAPVEPVIFVDSHGLHTVLHAGASEVRAYKPSSALIMSMPLTPLYLSPPPSTAADPRQEPQSGERAGSGGQGLHVEVRDVCVRDAPNAKLVWIINGHQSFTVADYWEDPEDAESFAECVRHAIGLPRDAAMAQLTARSGETK